MFRLDNKIAVITGGGSGIGRAISILFASQGATVHILEQDAENVDKTVGEIRAAGHKAHSHICDITKHDVVNKIMQKINGIDMLVNNAGIANIGKADTTKEEDFDKVVNVNIKGVYNCLHAVIPEMRKKKGGVIINMASVAALSGIPDRFAYSTSKGAILAMTLSVAKDYIHENIRCNSISPARVHTPFVDGFLKKSYPGKEAEMFEKLSKTQPIGRMATPEEIAALALYLCSNEASFLTGCDYPIDGGFVKLNN
jgi:2-keto-3-deoxy-L-fuconate dehydrogenase